MEGRAAEAAAPKPQQAFEGDPTQTPPPPPAQAPAPPLPLSPRSRPTATTTTLASLPLDILGEILLRVPRPGPASLAHRPLAAALREKTFRERHRQAHPSARRSLGAWAIGSADPRGAAMAAAMAAYAVAARDRARHRAAGIAWAPPPAVARGEGAAAV